VAAEVEDACWRSKVLRPVQLACSNNSGVLFPGGVLVTSNNDQLGSVTGRIGYTWGPGAALRQGRLCLEGTATTSA